MERIKTKIDWQPIIIGTDVNKIKDYGIMEENSLVNAIYNQLIMRKGVLTNDRNCGCWETLQSIPFADEIKIGEIQKELSESLSRTTDLTVSVDLTKETIDDRDGWQVTVTISEIPNKIFLMELTKLNARLVLTTPIQLNAGKGVV